MGATESSVRAPWHAALWGNIEHSPQQIAVALQNALALRLGNAALWSDGYYVGSFGGYNIAAIRRNLRPALAE